MRCYLQSFILSLFQWLLALAMVLSMLDIAGLIHLANLRLAMLGW